MVRRLGLALILTLLGCSSEPLASGFDTVQNLRTDGDLLPDRNAGLDAASDSGVLAEDASGALDALDLDAGASSDAEAAADAALPDLGPASDAAVAADGAAEDAGAARDAAALPDATPLDAASPDSGYVKTLRNSLSVCWTDPSCARRMAIGHGGDWSTFSAPYDSNAAIEAAYAHDMDGVKIDVRVTIDNVPVISHSSPIQAYESLDCLNQRIEQMTAAQVTQCHRFPSGSQTFQRLDDVLNYLRGKMVTQLTVKLSSDYARTIEVLHSLGAEDFAFMEISTAELQTQIPTLPGSDTIWYLINVSTNYAEVDTLIDTIHNPRAFMIELDLGAPVSGLISNRIHPAGLRSFTYDSSATAGVGELLGLFNQGFDVVSSQNGSNDVQARIQVNQSNSITPP